MVLELQPPERSVLLMLEGPGDLASRVQGLGFRVTSHQSLNRGYCTLNLTYHLLASPLSLGFRDVKGLRVPGRGFRNVRVEAAVGRKNLTQAG